MLDTAELLAGSYFDGKPAAAIRVDYFVRWGDADGDGERRARVWVNEVETGFNPVSLVGWFGARLALLALRFWVMGGGGGGLGGGGGGKAVQAADGLEANDRLQVSGRAQEGSASGGEVAGSGGEEEEHRWLGRRRRGDAAAVAVAVVLTMTVVAACARRRVI